MVRSMSAIAFVGGTGPEGLGLALRLAAAGDEVVIGSRTKERAEAAAATIRATVPRARAAGRTNLDAVARAERIVLTLPYAALAAFLESAGDAMAGKLVVDVIVPLTVRRGFAELVPVPGAGSVGELLHDRLPGSRIVSAFKNLSAEKLRDVGSPLQGDVVLCGEDESARAEVAAMVGRLPGLRAVDAGGIGNARYLEAITALLLNLNRRHHAVSSIAILGV